MRRSSSIRPGFWLVFWREAGWLKRRPFLLFMSTIAPLALIGLLTMIFSAGLATRLPIGVLDLDRTDLSRTIIRMVDATPDAAVAESVTDLAAGRRLLLSGRIHGLLMLPQHLERDVFAGRRPEVVFFYNAQTLTTGNLVLRGINAAIPTAAGGIRLSLRTAQGQPTEAAQSALQPIPVQVSPLFNPSLNYVFFLLATLLPSVLQIVITTTSAYSVGIDVETPHRLRILRRLGGGIWPAIYGTVFMTLLMTLAGVPVGIATAVYLTEYASSRSRMAQLVRVAVNNLAGVPSIVFGLFGLGFFVLFVGGTLDTMVYGEGTAPVWGKPSILWASLTLAVLTLPVVIVTTEEALRQVPKELREASLALGATRFQTVYKVVLPNAVGGILTGVILAVSRGAGEVAPIIFVGAANFLPYLPTDLRDMFMHLGYHVYALATQSPNVDAARPTLFGTVLVLLTLTFSLNFLAIIIRSRTRATRT